ncbi:MAG: YgaP-like transmembrane domain [Pseudomonadota bacterium]
MWKEFTELKNVGTHESGIRLGAGAVALLWGLTGGGLLITLLGAIGAVTGYYKSCQIYKLMGRNTNNGAA